jgi:hypothetical protein
MSSCNPHPRYILHRNSNITDPLTNATTFALASSVVAANKSVQSLDAYLNAVYLSILYNVPIESILIPQPVYNDKSISIQNFKNCESSIASVDLVQLPPIPQVCPVPKIKKAFYLDSVYKRCLKVHYAQLVTQGNDPNISNASRISQILSSKSLGGRPVFIGNGGANGQREGQPGGVVPPLRNRF